jgi:hypothetical protein
MSTTHIGKIGRLPRDTRHILGERIEDGIPNKELVAWLNGLPVVKDVLALRFGGRAITEQNLSEWKQTGHKEWVRREERRALALQLTEQREEMEMEPEESVAEKEISDRLGRELALEMARLAMELVDMEGSIEERWNRLCGVYREVAQMRRDDHRAERIRIQRERWRHELELEAAAAEAQERNEFKQKMLEVIRRPMMVDATAESYGGGKHGETMAELAERIKADEDPEQMMTWFKEAQKEWVKPEEPECSRAGMRKANGPGGRESGADPAAGEEEQETLCGVAPSPSDPALEKRQPTKPGGARPSRVKPGAQKGEEIRVNPSKSNLNKMTNDQDLMSNE